jgi:hypothetical protein
MKKKSMRKKLVALGTNELNKIKGGKNDTIIDGGVKDGGTVTPKAHTEITIS